MAKARKAKGEEQKVDNSEPVVRHQKLCLSIDMENRRIYGYTELEIAVPDNGIVGLHADNLAIESVTVDGEPAEFEVFPHYLHLDNGDRWCSVSTSTSAADAAGSVYLSSLERELVPNLLIMCAKSVNSEGEQHEETLLENGMQTSPEAKQNVKMVRIDYWVEKAETGIHFDDNVLHTDNQIRRARCWFPCMDDNMQRCCYDLEFTVANHLVAVSTGTLTYQVLTEDDPPRKRYVYKLIVPVTARWISLSVGPFAIIPDRHRSVLSHISLRSNMSMLQNTMGFFHSAFSHYEEYLSVSFPFGSYTQVFIAPDMAISSMSLGASMSIFSSQLLFDEKVIDQTIKTRTKLAYALARQWFGVYITAESPTDDWLLDGLAGFLTDSYIKRYLGNNEARYQRYKANYAVCNADDSGATALSSPAASKDLYGTQCIGFYGKIRSWKSVAILQMLEKQMGPESFRKILQNIVRSQDTTRSSRTLSTKEFRHLANKVGNLERPFLKEFFPRWVGSCGCPVLKMGFSYNKRKNIVELAVLRECTARKDPYGNVSNGNPDPENREGGVGWPGMMSIRVHELDGMYDHPILPMAGEHWQLLEIQCHSKFAAKRFQKSKKGSKLDGSDDNDTSATLEMRPNSDSPLLWLRADPEMEYLADIYFSQPVQMWINQLEKDKDVVAQSHAITTLEALPQLSFSVINALSNFLNDSKAFWRVRVEAAFALASTASEETDWAGFIHLIKFFKSRRFDANIGLPKPNDFHDFSEYFVLESIPHSVAMVRGADRKSPREAVEFVLQLLKYNDNSGNPFSDVFWLAELVQSIGELEFGQQTITYLPSLLKRLDRLLQFDRLMPSYNGILTISCIRSLNKIALKLSQFVPLDCVIELLKPFRSSKAVWQVRIAACRALLDLEFQSKGIDASLKLFIEYLREESSLRGQVKLGVHAMRMCQIRSGTNTENDVKSDTLVALLRLLESPMSFNNVILRHYLFCILQVLAGRAPTLYGVPRDETLRIGHAETCSELKNIFAALVKQPRHTEATLTALGLPQDESVPPEMTTMNTVDLPHDESVALEAATVNALGPIPGESVAPEACKNLDTLDDGNELMKDLANPGPDVLTVSEARGGDSYPSGHVERELKDDRPQDLLVLPGSSREADASIAEGTKPPVAHEALVISDASRETDTASGRREEEKPVADARDSSIAGAPKEPDTVSQSNERKRPILKIRVKKTVTSGRPDDPDNVTFEKTQNGKNDAEHGASSSVSVDAPQRNFVENVSASNQNVEDVNSCHDVGSRVTASIGSAKLLTDGYELVKELECTADSSKVSSLPDHFSTTIIKDNFTEEAHRYASLNSLSLPRNIDSVSKEREKTKDKDKKRKRDDQKGSRGDPEYLERKRLKKEKKQKKKEMAKLLRDEPKTLPSIELEKKKGDYKHNQAAVDAELAGIQEETETETRPSMAGGGGNESTIEFKTGETSGCKVETKKVDSSAPVAQAGPHKIRIKIKGRTLDK